MKKKTFLPRKSMQADICINKEPRAVFSLCFLAIGGVSYI